MLKLIVFGLFMSIILSLIWGRFRFFRMNSGTSWMTAFVYDTSVVVQMLSTIYGLLFVIDITKLSLWFCMLLYILSLMIFWFSVREAKALDFAFSDHVGDIVTTGTYSIFRHPFYVSYVLAWFAGTITFNTIYHWVTFIYLVFFYTVSAKKEEAIILKGAQSESYRSYQQQVGMFMPRVIKWKR
jgi:protein-S-isoprenylcysteine O-methyltransferase Ste14